MKLTDDELSCIPCFVDGFVKKKECKFCVCFFIGKDDILDAVVTDNFQFSIMNFIKNNVDDVKKEGFHIHVVSTSNLIEILEILEK